MSKRQFILSLLAVACIVGLLLMRRSAPAVEPSMIKNEGTIFGTIYHAKYLYDKDMKGELEAELQRVDASLSMFNPQSTISRINRGETDVADEMLKQVLELSYKVQPTEPSTRRSHLWSMPGALALRVANCPTAHRLTACLHWWDLGIFVCKRAG